jgi:drug/metabolite transporter (DMT)-like permease
MGQMSRRATALFVGLGIAWGIPYLLIKVAVEELSPTALVLGRTVLGTLLLLPLALWRREVVVVVRRWLPVVAFALIEIAIPWLFLTRAERGLPSSTTGLLISAVPLVGVAIAFLTGRAERMGLPGWLGLGVGLLGVAALVGLDVGGSDLISVAELSVTVVGYALGPVILSRWLNDLPGLGVMAVSLAIAAFVYLAAAVVWGGMPSTMPSGKVVWSVVGLATLCTALAFLMMFALVAELGPVRATAITYVNPAVAVIAGALILDEPVTVWKVVGFVLVLLGSYLVTRRPQTRAEEPILEPGCAAATAER